MLPTEQFLRHGVECEEMARFEQGHLAPNGREMAQVCRGVCAGKLSTSRTT
jgi:hypothetical protein